MTVLQQSREDRVAVAGGTLMVQRVGRGPAVIFLHGWTLDHRMWQPQLPLADDWTLIIPDRRGFGRSDAPPHLEREWADIDLLSDDRRIALVGLSQGASVALDYARRRPERIAALVLSGAPLPGLALASEASEALARDDYAALVCAGRLTEMKALWRRHPLTETNGAARLLVDAMLDDYAGRDLLAGPHRLSFSRGDIAALPMPVLAMTGEGDTAYRRDCVATIAALAPHGETALVPQAGHLANLDNPAGFNALVSDFLSRHFT